MIMLLAIINLWEKIQLKIFPNNFRSFLRSYIKAALHVKYKHQLWMMKSVLAIAQENVVAAERKKIDVKWEIQVVLTNIHGWMWCLRLCSFATMYAPVSWQILSSCVSMCVCHSVNEYNNLSLPIFSLSYHLQTIIDVFFSKIWLSNSLWLLISAWRLFSTMLFAFIR